MHRWKRLPNLAAMALVTCFSALTASGVADPAIGAKPVAKPVPKPPTASAPPAPCTFTAGPAALQTQWAALGGTRSFGCFVKQTSDGTYEFASGKMMMINRYGPNATLAAFIDRQQLIHLYWQTPSGGFNSWIVRLNADGVLVNQQTYKPGDRPYGGEVETTYGAGVIVHPGGHHGALGIGLEGCYTFGGLHASECSNDGWVSLTFNL